MHISTFIGGAEVAELEKRLAEYVGVKHVIACASGTDALTIPLMAYGVKKTDAVFVPSFTFFASGESVSLAGGTPVFVDSCRDTFNINPEALEETIEKNILLKENLHLRALLLLTYLDFLLILMKLEK